MLCEVVGLTQRKKDEVEEGGTCPMREEIMVTWDGDAFS